MRVAYPEVEQPKEIKPYRTFITVQRYNMESNGEEGNTISNVKLDITLPNGKTIELPGNSQYWPISNGQSQEINQTYEIPTKYIQQDGFKFKIQMLRKGAKFLPCEFDVVSLSEFNRSYVCRVDIGWQQQKGIPEEKLNKEAIQIRIFTDLNSPAKEIPTNAIVMKD